MMNTKFLQEYLQRIHYTEPLEPTLKVLKALQAAQAYTIPFENFDISLNIPIVLEFQSIFDKLVNKKRGGYCYELNGLLHFVLQAIGFKGFLCLARLMDEAGNLIPESVHMVIMVELEQRWLVDVGWGGGFIHPFCLDVSHEQQGYKIVQNGQEYTLYHEMKPKKWVKLYCFTLEKHSLQVFQTRNFYHQISIHSPFAKERCCILPTQQGYEMLKGSLYIKKNHQEKTEKTLKNDADYRHILSTVFDIHLDMTLPIWIQHEDYLLHYPRNRTEWETYHRIRQTQIHQKYCCGQLYDENDPEEKDMHHYPLVFRRSDEDQILGTIRIDLLPNQEASFRWVAIDASFTNKGLGTKMLLLAERFLQERSISLVRVPATEESQNFYKRLDYQEFDWFSMPEGSGTIALGKCIRNSRQI